MCEHDIDRMCAAVTAAAKGIVTVENTTWRNDVCPSFEATFTEGFVSEDERLRVKVWIDYDPANREIPDHDYSSVQVHTWGGGDIRESTDPIYWNTSDSEIVQVVLKTIMEVRPNTLVIKNVPLWDEAAARALIKASGKYTVRARGRGPRPSRSYHQSIPKCLATHFTMYGGRKDASCMHKSYAEWLGLKNGKPHIRLIEGP